MIGNDYSLATYKIDIKPTQKTKEYLGNTVKINDIKVNVHPIKLELKISEWITRILEIPIWPWFGQDPWSLLIGLKCTRHYIKHESSYVSLTLYFSRRQRFSAYRSSINYGLIFVCLHLFLFRKHIERHVKYSRIRCKTRLPRLFFIRWQSIKVYDWPISNVYCSINIEICII